MATTQSTLYISKNASADLSADQYLFVKVSGVDTVTVCSATTDLACGVLTNKPTSGQAASIAILGTTKVIAAGAITAGQKVAPTAAGKAQHAATGQFPVGVALQTSANDGDIIEILLLAVGDAIA